MATSFAVRQFCLFFVKVCKMLRKYLACSDFWRGLLKNDGLQILCSLQLTVSFLSTIWLWFIGKGRKVSCKRLWTCMYSRLRRDALNFFVYFLLLTSPIVDRDLPKSLRLLPESTPQADSRASLCETSRLSVFDHSFSSQFGTYDKHVA